MFSKYQDDVAQNKLSLDPDYDRLVKTDKMTFGFKILEPPNFGTKQLNPNLKTDFKGPRGQGAFIGGIGFSEWIFSIF